MLPLRLAVSEAATGICRWSLPAPPPPLLLMWLWMVHTCPRHQHRCQQLRMVPANVPLFSSMVWIPHSTQPYSSLEEGHLSQNHVRTARAMKEDLRLWSGGKGAELPGQM